MAGQALKMVREMSTAGGPAKTAGIVSPTENEIATVAYQLWLDSGCPIGSDLEHWLRAEAMLRNALTPTLEDPSRCPPPPPATDTGSKMAAKFAWERWGGHWEIWEREWACARWVWDARGSCARVANRDALTRRAAGA